MREKELRLALVCYGGISLAIYMHGITKEIWRLARASRAFHDALTPATTSQRVYRELLAAIEAETGVKLRVLVDIIAGASAGGINGVFLAQAIASGKSLEPLTDLWLERADVDVLLAPDKRPVSRFTKFWATPIAWAVARRTGGPVETTVAPEAQQEVSAKLSRFVRSKWFQPPFGGKGFVRLILDAFEAMDALPAEKPLLPEGQPLDLFVTVTDFHGHPQGLRLNSPAAIVETEHRLTLPFTDHGAEPRELGATAELTFAARATASFPGAFPPFTVGELDGVLEERGIAWPGRDAFLKRVLPRHYAAGTAETTALIDGSVLANAPFGPAVDALRDRPAHREVDRRFVYIDPKPGVRSIRMGSENDAVPGFFRTIFGALSDIPREQPIRDNLEAIEARSRRIRRLRRIVDAIRPQVEAAIESDFGRTFFLDKPTPQRLAAWRSKAQNFAAAEAGYAYASYGQLKLSGIVDEIAQMLTTLAGHKGDDDMALRRALWGEVRVLGLNDPDALSATGASDAAIAFFRDHDLLFRVRRLRFMLRRLSQIEELGECDADSLNAARDAVYDTLGDYLERERIEFYAPEIAALAGQTIADPAAALSALAKARDLKSADTRAEQRLAEALAALPKPERRTMLFAYLGFPFYDIATLPLLQGEGLDEFDPIKVDRIAPEDAQSIREGGVEATLKGIEFNSFGAFFSRVYRENDYLWGRLHGAERLIDIIVSTIPEGKRLAPGRVAEFKRRAFRAVIEEERDRLTNIPDLFAELEGEIG
ncbi:patatin-like protein [Parasphingopyxis marina]|uniref:Patatin-like protein n=1 Tax=Parasphingopyxis marina TaxID=2761622 RepID=A0A842I0K5_9SPHN|nr:patatin-like protein [Parasphingopyxis marina]MBC2778213.1 patatin-like protein [Parasphingopyxis marina]